MGGPGVHELGEGADKYPIPLAQYCDKGSTRASPQYDWVRETWTELCKPCRRSTLQQPRLVCLVYPRTQPEECDKLHSFMSETGYCADHSDQELAAD